MAFEFLAMRLQQRKSNGLLRKRVCLSQNRDGIIEINNKHYINFASNDYLGLSQHSQVQQAYAEGLSLYGTGSGSSSVVTGYSSEHKALEDDICTVLNKEAALLFASGFSANQAICHALFPSETVAAKNISPSTGQIICDKYMHASFIQGALETPAKLSRYKHNDMVHASKLIGKLAGTDSIVATESVFSMDGDLGKLKELSEIISQGKFTEKSKPYLLVDDAHGFGVLGESGFGCLDYTSLSEQYVDPNKVDIVMGTFGKALGTGGAFVAGSKIFIEYMVNFAKHYVYSTAISAAQARATRASLALVEKGLEREKLYNNITLFKALAGAHALPVLPSNSAIQPLIIGCPERAVRISHKLAELGIWVCAIRTPTVPKNTDRLRITISAMHNEQDIHALVDALALTVHT